MTTKAYLIAARAKIADPAEWTQHALARDAEGSDKPSSHPLANHIHWEGLNGRDKLACQWCAMGAVQSVTPAEEELNVLGRLHVAARKMYLVNSIAYVNDDIGHAEVLKCFDQAIGDAE